MAKRITRDDIETSVNRLNRCGNWKDGDDGFFYLHRSNGQYTLGRWVTMETSQGPRLQWTKIASRSRRDMVAFIDAFIDGYLAYESDELHARHGNRYPRI
jgi:hypothetical protein